MRFIFNFRPFNPRIYIILYVYSTKTVWKTLLLYGFFDINIYVCIYLYIYTYIHTQCSYRFAEKTNIYIKQKPFIINYYIDGFSVSLCVLNNIRHFAIQTIQQTWNRCRHRSCVSTLKYSLFAYFILHTNSNYYDIVLSNCV